MLFIVPEAPVASVSAETLGPQGACTIVSMNSNRPLLPAIASAR